MLYDERRRDASDFGTRCKRKMPDGQEVESDQLDASLYFSFTRGVVLTWLKRLLASKKFAANACLPGPCEARIHLPCEAVVSYEFAVSRLACC